MATYTVGSVSSETMNWMRKYRIKIYQHTEAVSTSTNSKTYNTTFSQPKDSDVVLDVSDLRCKFTVKRIAQCYPNTAQVTIYNLNATTENTIIQEGYRIIIEAGYQSNYGQIFDGEIIMCTRSKQDGTDYILNILALDGNQFLNESYCSFTYAKGQTAREVVQNVCNKASNPIPLGYASPQLDSIKLSKGIAVAGQPKQTLNDIAKSINGTWFVDKGRVYVIAYSDSADKLPSTMSGGQVTEAVELNPQTGLLGNPQQENYGVRAQCLLNPKLMPYGMIHITNKYITEQMVSIGSYSQGVTIPYVLDPSGLYRICSVVFDGDTRGNNWYSNIVAVGQTGDMASMLTNAAYTAN